MSNTTNYQNHDILGFKAASAMVVGQPIKITAGEVATLCGDGENSDGITLDAVTAVDDVVGVIDKGKVLGLSGAAYADAAELASNGSAKLITAVAGKKVIAIALEAAGAADELHPVKFLGHGQYAKA